MADEDKNGFIDSLAGAMKKLSELSKDSKATMDAREARERAERFIDNKVSIIESFETPVLEEKFAAIDKEIERRAAAGETFTEAEADALINDVIISTRQAKNKALDQVDLVQNFGKNIGEKIGNVISDVNKTLKENDVAGRVMDKVVDGLALATGARLPEDMQTMEELYADLQKANDLTDREKKAINQSVVNGYKHDAYAVAREDAYKDLEKEYRDKQEALLKEKEALKASYTEGLVDDSEASKPLIEKKNALESQLIKLENGHQHALGMRNKDARYLAGHMDIKLDDVIDDLIFDQTTEESPVPDGVKESRFKEVSNRYREFKAKEAVDHPDAQDKEAREQNKKDTAYLKDALGIIEEEALRDAVKSEIEWRGSSEMAVPESVKERDEDKFKSRLDRFLSADQNEYDSARNELLELQRANDEKLAKLGSSEVGKILEQERILDRAMYENAAKHKQDRLAIEEKFGDVETYNYFKRIAAKIDDNDKLSSTQKVAMKEQVAGYVKDTNSQAELHEKVKANMKAVGLDSTAIESEKQYASIHITAEKVGKDAETGKGIYKIFVQDKRDKDSQPQEIKGNTLDLSGLNEGTRVKIKIDKDVKKALGGDKLDIIGDEDKMLDFVAPGSESRYVATESKRRRLSNGRVVIERNAIKDENGNNVFKSYVNHTADKFANPADIINSSNLDERNAAQLTLRGKQADAREDYLYEKNRGRALSAVVKNISMVEEQQAANKRLEDYIDKRGVSTDVSAERASGKAELTGILSKSDDDIAKYAASMDKSKVGADGLLINPEGIAQTGALAAQTGSAGPTESVERGV